MSLRYKKLRLCPGTSTVCQEQAEQRPRFNILANGVEKAVSTKNNLCLGIGLFRVKNDATLSCQSNGDFPEGLEVVSNSDSPSNDILVTFNEGDVIITFEAFKDNLDQMREVLDGFYFGISGRESTEPEFTTTNDK